MCGMHQKLSLHGMAIGRALSLSRSYHALPFSPWWRHQTETFSASLAICAGNSPVTGEFPAQKPVTRSFDVFFDFRLNKRLRKQSGGWWFQTLALPLWRHRNVIRMKYATSSSAFLALMSFRQWVSCVDDLRYWTDDTACWSSPNTVLLYCQWRNVWPDLVSIFVRKY